MIEDIEDLLSKQRFRGDSAGCALSCSSKHLVKSSGARLISYVRNARSVSYNSVHHGLLLATWSPLEHHRTIEQLRMSLDSND